MPPKSPDNQSAPTPITPMLPPSETGEFKRTSRRDTWRSVISTLLILIAAPLIALSITSFVFQSYEVDGPSMQSTLQNGDRLIVLKWPATAAHLRHRQYVP